MSTEPLNILIAGVGGQGNVLVSKIIAEAVLRTGLHTAVANTFGVSQRGGSVMSSVRLYKEGNYGPLIPRGEADVILGLEPLETLRAVREYGSRQSRVISSDRAIFPLEVLRGNAAYLSPHLLVSEIEKLSGKLLMINAAAAAEALGHTKIVNIILLGALAQTDFLPVKSEVWEQVLLDNFSGEMLTINLQAFHKGRELVPSGAKLASPSLLKALP